MNKQEVIDSVLAVTEEQFGLEKGKVKLEQEYVKDLGADSLDVVELVMEIEDEFEISIEDTDAEKMRNGNHVVDFVCTKLQVTE